MMGWRIGAIGVGLLIVAACSGPAAAQDAAPAQRRSAAYRQTATACVPELARFCPPIDQSTALPRDQAMCLKLYRADLSLPCRNAVTAATASAQPAPGAGDAP